MNQPAQSPSILWIEIEDRFRVVALAHHGPQTRQVLLSSFGWRRFDLSSVPENVSIGRSAEALDPGGPFFGFDPVKNSNRCRDVPHEIVIACLVAEPEYIEGNQTIGQPMCGQETGEQDDRQTPEQ